MKRLTTYSKFTNSDNKQLFESNDDVKDIVSIVKDMLLELNFLDIDSKCELVPYGLKKVNFVLFGDEAFRYVIVINLSKRAIKLGDGIGDGYKASYTWSDIKDVMDPVIDYLKEEGFLYRKDQGTLSYGGIPIISTSGSSRLDNIKSKLEMWFIR
jgi:hypothetical protein